MFLLLFGWIFLSGKEFTIFSSSRFKWKFNGQQDEDLPTPFAKSFFLFFFGGSRRAGFLSLYVGRGCPSFSLPPRNTELFPLLSGKPV